MSNVNRIMLAAPSSGSGKTLITCGLLELLKRRGMRIASFKCGPDFIDPMFHTKVIGTKSRNLDTFFTGEERTKELLLRNSKGCDISVLEGVMGYFDGMGINSSKAGASDLAGVTDTPVLLIVPAKGLSRSILPIIKGFLDFQSKPCIKGVILNRVSAMMYPRMKEMIEKELDIAVCGYVPVLEDGILESRHLGLMMPDEIKDLRKSLSQLADQLEYTLDIEKILEIANTAPEITSQQLELKSDFSDLTNNNTSLRIGLAKDEAFCFFYEDNLQYLRDRGVELVPFSPIHDEKLPEHLDGLLLHGGYPELYVKQLSENTSMIASVQKAIKNGLPTMAECGGFLYLFETVGDIDGNEYPMTGILSGKAFYTGHLTRFGYLEMDGGKVFGESVGPIRSHEFHYYDTENNGDAFIAKKPLLNRSWSCVHSTDSLFAGFPHLYYYANPGIADAFIARCERGVS